MVHYLSEITPRAVCVLPHRIPCNFVLRVLRKGSAILGSYLCDIVLFYKLIPIIFVWIGNHFAQKIALLNYCLYADCHLFLFCSFSFECFDPFLSTWTFDLSWKKEAFSAFWIVIVLCNDVSDFSWKSCLLNLKCFFIETSSTCARKQFENQNFLPLFWNVSRLSMKCSRRFIRNIFSNSVEKNNSGRVWFFSFSISFECMRYCLPVFFSDDSEGAFDLCDLSVQEKKNKMWNFFLLPHSFYNFLSISPVAETSISWRC